MCAEGGVNRAQRQGTPRKFACYMWEKHTTDTGQSFGKDLGAARSRLGSAHDVMPRVVVVVIVIVVVVVQIPASREAELGRHVV